MYHNMEKALEWITAVAGALNEVQYIGTGTRSAIQEATI